MVADRIPPPPPGYRPSTTVHQQSMRLPPPNPPSQSGTTQSGAAASVPIEKVIDDVAVMGFSREDVRRVLRELMESGQSVDLNIVLDRLGAR